jgi:hypothetical protein
MSKRPKSREETPKEGSGSAERYRTATICDRAAQSARVFGRFSMQNLHGLQACNTLPPDLNFADFSAGYKQSPREHDG